MFESLEVNLRLTAPRTLAGRIAVELRSATGTRLTGGCDVLLSAGTQQVAVRFSGQELWLSRDDGPWTVSAGVLDETGGTIGYADALGIMPAFPWQEYSFPELPDLEVRIIAARPRLDSASARPGWETDLVSVAVGNVGTAPVPEFWLTMISGDGSSTPSTQSELVPGAAPGTTVELTFEIERPPGTLLVTTLADEEQFCLDANRTNNVALRTFTVPLDEDSDGLPDLWEKQHFDDWTAASPALDADGDGLTNVQEYLLQLDPQKVDAPRVSVVTAGSEGTIRLQIEGVYGRAIAVEVSEDLTTWSACADPVVAESSVELEVPTSGGMPYCFYRVALP